MTPCVRVILRELRGRSKDTFALEHFNVVAGSVLMVHDGQSGRHMPVN